MKNVTYPRPAINAELQRIEEDCIHSGKAHFNAGVRWARYHYGLGVPSVVLSALAGLAFFKDYPEVAGAMSGSVAILTSLITFLKPSERSVSHKNSGDQYLSLRNDARVFREIKQTAMPDEQAAIDGLDEIIKRRNELNQVSAQFSQGDFDNARRGIDAGEAAHRVDRNKP